MSSKLTALSAWTPSLASLVYVVDDPSGSPIERKATIASIRTLFGGLTYTDGPADGDQAMAVNTVYVVDMSGYNLNHTYTLPATAAVGDVCGIVITVGNTSYEILMTATAGDTLNGIAGGTEWSRLLNTGEVIMMRCVVANTTWIVDEDGRIPCRGWMALTTGADGESAATLTVPTSASTPGVWTVTTNVGAVMSAANSQVLCRRNGEYFVTAGGRNKDNGTAGQYFGLQLLQAGSASSAAAVESDIVSLLSTNLTISRLFTMVVDDTVTYKFRSQAGNLGLALSTGTVLSVFEVLP